MGCTPQQVVHGQNDSPVCSFSGSFNGSRFDQCCAFILPGWQLVADHIEEERFLVQRLRQGTTYLFLVRAVNDRGIGPPSPISQPITTRGKNVTHCQRYCSCFQSARLAD